MLGKLILWKHVIYQLRYKGYNKKRILSFFNRVKILDMYRNIANIKNDNFINWILSILINLKIDIEITKKDATFSTKNLTNYNKDGFAFQLEKDNTKKRNNKYYSLDDLINLLKLENIESKNINQLFSVKFIPSLPSYPNEMYDEIISLSKEKKLYEDLNKNIFELFDFEKIDILRGEPKLLKKNNYLTLVNVRAG